MPENKTPSHLGLYRADFTSPEHRNHITVARQNVVDDALDLLRGSMDRRSKHHFLFIGPRGIGKTHLLSLIADGIHSDQVLNQRMVVVRFPEEANRVLSYADFLLGMVEILRDTLPDEPAWGELYERFATEEEDRILVDHLEPHIRKNVADSKRTFLVMLENLNELFTRQIRHRKERAAFRKFFMGTNGCLLIATAPLHFDAITNAQEPFFDFFDVQLLDSLSADDTIDLIHRNLTWEKRSDLLEQFDDMRPKLLAVFRLTGGNPRLTLMLYELIAHESITEIRQQFSQLLDRITPFYQDRLNDLPPQERAVLETMANMRDQEKPPASIAKQMRMGQPQLSSLLKRLSDAHYLRSSPHPDDKRRRLYTIREGFFDIWLYMNVSRGARQRIPFLLDFFALFYPQQEDRERKREELRSKLQQDGEHPDAEATLDYLTAVGAPDEQLQAKLDLAALHTERGNTEKARGCITEARALPLDPVGRWIVDHAEPKSNYLDEIQDMIQCWEQHRSGDLEAFSEQLHALGETLNYKNYSEIKIDFLRDHLVEVENPQDRARIRNRIGVLLTDLARWQDAEKQFHKAIQEAASDGVLHSTLLNNLAQLLKDTNRLAEAEPLMRRALSIDEASYGEEHPAVARDLNNLAQLLKATNRLAEAEPLMRQALSIDEASYGEEHPAVARDLNNLAQLLKDTNRLAEAEPLMRRALSIDEASYGGEHPEVATDMNNLALLLKDTNRLAEAEPLMRRALSIDEASYGVEHPVVAIRLNNLAQLLQATNRLAEAEPLMRRALSIDEASYGGEHPEVATDMNNLAQLLQATNRLAEAEPLMRQALSIDEASYGVEHPVVAIRLNNLAQLLQATNRLAEAEPLMRQALSIDEASYGEEHPAVAIDLNNLAQLLKATNRLAEAEPLMRRALSIDEASYGEEHPVQTTIK